MISWWKIGVVDEAWRDNDDSAFVTKEEEKEEKEGFGRESSRCSRVVVRGNLSISI